MKNNKADLVVWDGAPDSILSSYWDALNRSICSILDCISCIIDNFINFNRRRNICFKNI